MSEIDSELADAMFTEIMGGMMKQWQLLPYTRDNVYTGLNALAACVALIINGTQDRDALDFFNLALEQNLEDMGNVTTH